MSIGGTLFDQLVPNKLWASDGIGVWNTTNLPTANFQWNTPVVWHDQSIGIEQLVANEIVVPPGGHPVLASWDRPFFYVADPNAYPSTYGPVMGGQLSRAGRSIMHRRIRTFSWGLPTGGALRSRAIQPMAARPGLFRKLPTGCRHQLHWRNDRRKLADKHYMGACRRCAAILHPQRRRNLEPHHSAGCFQLEWV